MKKVTWELDPDRMETVSGGGLPDLRESMKKVKRFGALKRNPET